MMTKAAAVLRGSRWPCCGSEQWGKKVSAITCWPHPWLLLLGLFIWPLDLWSKSTWGAPSRGLKNFSRGLGCSLFSHLLWHKSCIHVCVYIIYVWCVHACVVIQFQTFSNSFLNLTTMEDGASLHSYFPYCCVEISNYRLSGVKVKTEFLRGL